MSVRRKLAAVKKSSCCQLLLLVLRLRGHNECEFAEAALRQQAAQHQFNTAVALSVASCAAALVSPPRRLIRSRDDASLARKRAKEKLTALLGRRAHACSAITATQTAELATADDYGARGDHPRALALGLRQKESRGPEGGKSHQPVRRGGLLLSRRPASRHPAASSFGVHRGQSQGGGRISACWGAANISKSPPSFPALLLLATAVLLLRHWQTQTVRSGTTVAPPSSLTRLCRSPLLICHRAAAEHYAT